MIRPPPWARRCGSEARMSWMDPVRLVARRPGLILPERSRFEPVGSLALVVLAERLYG